MQLEQLNSFLPALWTLMAFNFVGNVVVLAIILKSSVLRRKPAIMYIINGAVVNILFCLTAQGAGQLLRVFSQESATQVQCLVYDILFFLMSFVMVFTIAAIALDKYLAIMKPFFYHQHDNKRTARILIACSWIFAALLSGPKFVTVLSETSSRLCRETPEVVHPTSELVSEIITVFIVCLVPSVIIIAVYGRLFYRLWISNRISQATDIGLLKTRRKLTTLMIIVTFLFLFCWMPYCVSTVWWCLGLPLPKPVYWCESYASIFIFAYSGISPLIYACSNETVVREIKKCFCCCCTASKVSGRAVAPSAESRVECRTVVGHQVRVQQSNV